MPPSVEAMKATREVARSTSAERYSSRSMAEPSSTKTRLTTRPAGPVWMVTSVLPSICSAAVLTSSIDLTMRTPPLSPAAASLNLPLPRPPAWIWAFTTHTGPGRPWAAFTASAGVKAGPPSATGTPKPLSSCLAWYSWTFMEAPWLEFAAPTHARGTPASVWYTICQTALRPPRPSFPLCETAIVHCERRSFQFRLSPPSAGPPRRTWSGPDRARRRRPCRPR